ncbi:MAG: CopD family protein [Vicinamibacterales bacterium]|nr:CopD family protein [Vicinamibacterales bacterium]
MLDEAMAWWYHAAAFLYISGLVLVVGAAAAAWLVPVPARVPLLTAVVLAAGVAARLVAQGQMAFGEMGGLTREFTRLIVFETPWGWGWRWQAATAAAVLLAAIIRRVTGPARIVREPLGVVLAMSAVAAAALTGHAMAFPELIWAMVPLHALHVAGAGLWMGTLAVLLVRLGSIGRDARDGAARREAVALTFARFSSLAVVAVGVMAVSGVVAGGLHLGEWTALWSTSYGRMLLLKVGVFALAGACGAYNWQRVRPGLAIEDEATRQLRRVGSIEVALGVVVLALTSLLAALPMPAEGA